jgi:phosphoenolpyruvate---glycerone phosphotransferase subunit DhaL
MPIVQHAYKRIKGRRVMMKTLELTDVKKILGIIAETSIEQEQYFCKLDAAAGDGDFGSTLAKGFKIIRKHLAEFTEGDAGELLKSSGMLIMKSCGGASGSLWGSAFRSAGKAIEGTSVLDARDCGRCLQEFCNGMKKVGGAVVGDKTIIDALEPAAELFAERAEAGESDILRLIEAAAAASAAGAESTKHFVARKGRATYLGERSIGHPDAGAVAVSIMFANVHEGIRA